MMKNDKGVTMIALIIVIIILILLSGVTFTTTLNSGIIDNTKELSQEAEVNNLKENLKMDFLAEKNKTGSRIISYEQVESVVRQNITSEEDLIKNEENQEIIGVKTQSGYEVYMDEIKNYMSDEANIIINSKE